MGCAVLTGDPRRFMVATPRLESLCCSKRNAKADGGRVMRSHGQFLTAAFVMAGLLVASNAAADPVDNPGTFTIVTADGGTAFRFPNLQEARGGVNTIIFDLNSSGAINSSTASAAFSTANMWLPAPLGAVNAQLFVTEVSGDINAYYKWVNIVLRARIRFTGGSISGSCLTPIFSVIVKAAALGPGPISSFQGLGDVPIQPIPDGTCSQARELNRVLGLDRDEKSYIMLDGAKVDEPIKGS
jgi:hypothetical protein